ncbi:DUF1129 family protein [Salinicoccus sp. YB14-2]|uniref:DUF1129 family protein n=1 Tax=Salinicoccus sp. YB14-2 TaxID=1572701 RepID=UPI000691E3A6|nr:DUF1129 family protein [Salinicoccus sp. YB14-2]
MDMTKALIQENNDKRELLTGDNKKMYEDFLVYLRTDLRIDEYQGEEILMEILNHLLEAQADGVDADEIFGNNPKGFADELIAELPSEKKRGRTDFIAGQFLNIVAFLLIIQGMLSFVLPYFTEIDQSVGLGNTVLLGIMITIIVLTAIRVVFKLIRQSLFKENHKKAERIAMLKAAVYGMFGFGIIMAAAVFVPEFGPVINVEWWAYIIGGLVVYVIGKLVKK